MNLNWTKQRPKSSGWYWVTNNSISETFIAKFKIEENKCTAMLPGQKVDLKYYRDDENVMFAGPIVEPRNPRI